MFPTSISIMVVDDEPDIVTVLKMILERWGAKVSSFTNPLLALEAFKKEPLAYDLVITDIRMPIMNGVQLAKEILVIKPNMPVMYLSAFELDHQTFGAVQTSQMIIKENLLTKPVALLELCNAVKKRI
jgi:CheY-like chemotaxis protein